MKSKNSLLGLLFAIIFFIFVSGFLVVQYSLSPVDPSQMEKTRFVIPKGQAVSIIGQRLTEEGYIRHPLVFRALVLKDNLDKKLQSGSFLLSPDMSAQEIVIELTKGSEDVWVTILEGWRVEEIAESLAEQDLEDFDQDLFLQLAASDEGKLFPDSYLIPREFSTEQIYDLLMRTFRQKVVNGLADEIEASDYTFDQVIVLASLVEREARGYEQMRQVAGILENRLEMGMALQLDATLQYIEGYNQAEQSWWSPPRVSTKQTISPYNTYLNPGLPPKPIANPSLDAVRAVLNPIPSDNLYYLHSTDGTLYYARTLEEHNANVSRYLR